MMSLPYYQPPFLGNDPMNSYNNQFMNYQQFMGNSQENYNNFHHPIYTNAPMVQNNQSLQPQKLIDGHKSEKEERPPSRTERRKRIRCNFDNNQAETLEKHFQRSKYISNAERFNLAKELNITECRVKTWFQNRRQKEKRENLNCFDLKKHIRRSSRESPTTDTSSRYATPSPVQWDHQIDSPHGFTPKMPQNTMQHQYDQTIHSSNYMPYAYLPVQPIQSTPLQFVQPIQTCTRQDGQPQFSSFSNGNHGNANTFESPRTDCESKDELAKYCFSEDSTKSYDLSTANFEQFMQQNTNTPQQDDFINQQQSLDMSLDLNISNAKVKSILDLSTYWHTFENFE